jgi:hypothetical protein
MCSVPGTLWRPTRQQWSTAQLCFRTTDQSAPSKAISAMSEPKPE